MEPKTPSSVAHLVDELKAGLLSDDQAMTALSALHKSIRSFEADAPRPVHHSSPSWRPQPPSPGAQGEPAELLVVLNFSRIPVRNMPFLESLQKRSRIQRQIDLCDSDELLLGLASPASSTFAGHAFLTALDDRSIRSADVLIIESREQDQSVPEAVFLGRCLFAFLAIQRVMKSLPAAAVRYLSVSDERGMFSLSGVLTGLLKTVVLENKSSSAKTLWLADLQARPARAADICSELQAMMPGHYEEVSLESGDRRVRVFQDWQPCDLRDESSAPTFTAGDVVLISGGLGGIGRLLTAELIERYNLKCVVFARSGRNELPGDLQRFVRQYASNLIYEQADACDPDQVRALFAKADAAFGAVNVIIHAAGVFRDSWIVNKTLPSVRDVIRPKILGAHYLDHCSRDRGLKYFINFSSIATHRGSIGQGDYALANSFLDHFAHAREVLRAAGERAGKCLSINWPLWQDGGMHPRPAVAERLLRRGITPMGTREGLATLRFLLRGSGGQFMVSSGDIPDPGTSRSAPETTVKRDSSEAAIRQQFQLRLTGMVAEITKVDCDDIQADRHFGDYGFDSISLTELAGRITDEYPFVDLDPATFLDHPFLNDLCGFLFERHAQEFLQGSGGRQNAGLPKAESSVQYGARAGARRQTSEPAPSYARSGDIAIIGIGGRMPGSRNLIEFWTHLLEGRSSIEEVPIQRWDWRAYSGDPKQGDKTDCFHGSFLRDIECFDYRHFDISAREAELMDPQQRLLLEATWETLENAGYAPGSLSGRNVGVFIGAEKHDYLHIISASGCPLDGYINTGNAHSILANRLSHYYNWKGPSSAIDTACASSFSAIFEAVNSIRSGQSEMALAGGVNVLLNPGLFVVNRKLGMFTNERMVKPFDKSASGHLCGEGLGLLLLKDHAAAVRDGDPVYGVIKAMVVKHGGKGVFLTAPNAGSHVEVIREALAHSGLSPADIDYVEAQGTGDRVADTTELRTYQNVFAGRAASPIRIGTVKGHTGHFGAASGVIAVIKAILSLRNDCLIGVKNLEVLNWDAKDGPFAGEVLSANTPWPAPEWKAGKAVPRRVGVHNFGYGGIIGHLVLEEALDRHDRSSSSASQVIPLSARTEDQLLALASSLLQFLERDEQRLLGFQQIGLEDIAHTLQTGREAMKVRAAFVADGVDSFVTMLNAFVSGRRTPGIFHSGDLDAAKHTDGKLSRIAESWVSGADVDWSSLHRGPKPRRIGLPTYPFAKRRCWVAPHPSTDRQTTASDHLHPLVHENTSNFLELGFTSRFTGSETFFTDHVVGGKRTLPAAAFLEMARFAAEQLDPSARGGRADRPKVVRLRNLVWSLPLIAGDRPLQVQLRLKQNARRQVVYEIRAEDASSHHQGVVTFPDIEEVRSIDREALQARIGRRRYTAAQCYRTLESLGVLYGPAFQAIRSLSVCGDEILAELRLPSADPGLSDALRLSPCMTDAALHAAVGFTMSDEGSAPGLFLPYALEEADIIGSCPSSLWAWLRREDAGVDTGLQTLHVDMFDADGRICVSMKGLHLRRVEVHPPGVAQAAMSAAASRSPGTFIPSAPEFKSTLSGKEFFLRDHGGLLPGVMYLELARMAEAKMNRKVTGFRNVVWSEPLRFAGRPLDVFTRLFQEGPHSRYQITTRRIVDGELQTLIHSQGSMFYFDRPEGREHPLALEDIQGRCSVDVSAEDVAAATLKNLGGETMKGSFRTLRSMQFNSEEALAALLMPEGAEEEPAALMLSAGMLTGALHAVALWHMLTHPGSTLPVPYAVKELHLHGTLAGSGYAYMRVDESSDPQNKRYTVDITDGQGRTVVAMGGLSLACADPGSASTARADMSRALPVHPAADSVRRELVDLVSRLQKVPSREIDPHENLLAYGFDSLGFTMLGNLINERYGLELMPTIFFEYPTVDAVARYLDSCDPAGGRQIDCAETVQTQAGAVNLEQRKYRGTFLEIYRQLFRGVNELETRQLDLPGAGETEVIVAGSGDPVMLLSPFGCLPTVWVRQFRMLSKKYRVISWNYPGHGGTEYRNGDLHDLSRHAFEVLDCLNIFRPIHLVGWSMGGLVAQIMAGANGERVRSLTLVNSSARLAEQAGTAGDFSEILNALNDEKLPGSFKKHGEAMPRFFKACYSPFVSLHYVRCALACDLSDEVTRLAVKTLVISGGSDRIIPPSHSSYIGSKVPKAAHEQLESAGHYLPLTYARWLNSRLAAFFEDRKSSSVEFAHAAR
ncbi:MAG TPA: alpha/beta fold hydrolase [Thermoanaerobaculia bacterium]